MLNSANGGSTIHGHARYLPREMRKSPTECAFKIWWYGTSTFSASPSATAAAPTTIAGHCFFQTPRVRNSRNTTNPITVAEPINPDPIVNNETNATTTPHHHCTLRTP